MNWTPEGDTLIGKAKMETENGVVTQVVEVPNASGDLEVENVVIEITDNSADEPTTALDVRVQSQIIEVLHQINREQKTMMLFIPHELNLARRLCERIAVMKEGLLVEIGKTEKVFGNPSAMIRRGFL